MNRKGDANHDRQNARQAKWQRRERRGGSMKGQSGGKRKRDWVGANKRNGDIHKPAAKPAKLKKVGKKRLKINK